MVYKQRKINTQDDSFVQCVSPRMINALEKSFYGTSGKAGKDEDGYSYFDLISDRAINYIVLDKHGKFIVIDPRDKTSLKILMAY